MSKAAKIIPINNNLSFVDKETKEKKRTYSKVWRDLIYIPRANNPNKPLSKEARDLATTYKNKINKSKNGIIFVNHDFISSITETRVTQNKNIHNELKDLFTIQYHKSAIVEGKKFHYGFTIEFTENTEIILKDPTLFYSLQSHENQCLTVGKLTHVRQKTDDLLYIDKDKLKEKENRSIETEEKIPTPANEETRSNFEKNILEKDKKVLALKDYYPLSKEDCHRLQQISKRSFTQHAMNEILLDMSRDTPAVFYHKKGFFSYFGDCLAKELRDPFKTRQETFRIAANVTPEEKEEREINKYLGEVEYSLQVSPEDHFRKKIAGGTLLPKKAFNFLNSYRSIEIQGDIAKIYLRHEVELSEMDLNIVLNQIKATHEIVGNPPITEIRLITPNSTKPAKEMSNINQQILDSFGSVRGQEILKICNIIPKSDDTIQVEVKTGELLEENDKCLLRQCIKTVYGEVKISTNQPKLEDKIIHLDQRNDTNWPLWETKADIWEKFKKGILEQLRTSEGEHIFKAWFDKLERSQDISANKLTLTGKELWISYISQNYSRLIENTVKSKKINVTLVYEGRENPGYRPIVFTPTEGRKF